MPKPVSSVHSPFRSMKVDGVTFSLGAEAANARTLTMDFTLNGKSISERASLLAYLSDDANGDSVAATAPSGGVAVATDGLAIPLVAGKTWLLTSEADGDIALAITEATAKTFYLIVVLPSGELKVSPAIEFAA